MQRYVQLILHNLIHPISIEWLNHQDIYSTILKLLNTSISYQKVEGLDILNQVMCVDLQKG
jgi:hypothetical protein